MDKFSKAKIRGECRVALTKTDVDVCGKSGEPELIG